MSLTALPSFDQDILSSLGENDLLDIRNGYRR